MKFKLNAQTRLSRSALCSLSFFSILILSFFYVFFFNPEPSRAAVGSGLNLVIDGQKIDSVPPPVIINGRTLVPVRLVAEKLGAKVDWAEQTRSVTIERNHRLLKLRVDHRLVDLDDGGLHNYLSDVPPQIISDRTFVPLRLVSTALGVSVQWEAATKTVFVDSRITPAAAPEVGVRILSVQPGQMISGAIDLRAGFIAAQPATGLQVRYQLLDPATGRGPVIARGNNLTGSYRFLPDPFYSGRRLLTAVVVDSEGRFLTGTVVPVNVAVTPVVSLSGLSPGQTAKGSVQLGTDLNFVAAYVRYIYTGQNTGKVTEIAKADPQGAFSWTPRLGDQGEVTVQAVAYDRLGVSYSSLPVPVTVVVERQLELGGVKAGGTVSGPVNLRLSANFSPRSLKYILRDPLQGTEEVLKQYDTAASYRWLPKPEQSGNRELLVQVEDDIGITRRSAAVAVTVSGSPQIFLESVGPNQVLTGEVPLKYLANVPVTAVEYQLIDPVTGAERRIAGGSDPAANYAWVPGKTDGGTWQLRVAATTSAGGKLFGKAIPVRVYTGTLFSSAPVIEKSLFKDLAAGLAVRSQTKTGMSAALQVAQAILETGWGQYTPVDKYTGQLSYNLFGIKGEGPAGSVTSNTWEEYNGISFRIDASFRAYHNVMESWDDHKRLLLNASRYAQFRSVMHDSTLGAWALKRAGYATDSQYPLKLMDLVKRYDLYLLDELDI